MQYNHLKWIHSISMNFARYSHADKHIDSISVPFLFFGPKIQFNSQRHEFYAIMMCFLSPCICALLTTHMKRNVTEHCGFAENNSTGLNAFRQDPNNTSHSITINKNIQQMIIIKYTIKIVPNKSCRIDGRLI